MREGASGIILAGGESRRMGRDKAFLPWGKTTLIEHLLERLRPVTNELIVAVKDARAFRHLRATVVEDCVSDAHALGGLYTGLRTAHYDWCFVCACDVPFLQPALIRFLIEQVEGYDAVIPQTPTGTQPLYAVYRKSALPAIEDQLHQQQFTLARLIERLHVKIVEIEALHRFDLGGLSFLNVNTPEDYARARRLRLVRSKQRREAGIHDLHFRRGAPVLERPHNVVRQLTGCAIFGSKYDPSLPFIAVSNSGNASYGLP